MEINGYTIAPKAHLRGADLRGAHLQGAHLQGAHLRGADFRGAHLQGTQTAIVHGFGPHELIIQPDTISIGCRTLPLANIVTASIENSPSDRPPAEILWNLNHRAALLALIEALHAA